MYIHIYTTSRHEKTSYSSTNKYQDVPLIFNSNSGKCWGPHFRRCIINEFAPGPTLMIPSVTVSQAFSVLYKICLIYVSGQSIWEKLQVKDIVSLLSHLVFWPILLSYVIINFLYSKTFIPDSFFYSNLNKFSKFF